MSAEHQAWIIHRICHRCGRKFNFHGHELTKIMCDDCEEELRELGGEG